MAATSEDIQTLILTTLDSQGAIENTNTLKNPDGTPIPYLAVVGVLKSLASKEVCGSCVVATIWRLEMHRWSAEMSEENSSVCKLTHRPCSCLCCCLLLIHLDRKSVV